MWTQIRLLLQEQSDLVPHCLSKMLISKTFQQMTKLMIFVVIGTFRINYSKTCLKWPLKKKSKNWFSRLIIA